MQVELPAPALFGDRENPAQEGCHSYGPAAWL